jgi:hypothetical protein
MLSLVSTFSITTRFRNLTDWQIDAHQGAVGTGNPMNPYDTYITSSVMSGTGVGNAHSQINPYAQDSTGMGAMPAGFYQGGQNGYAQPVSYYSMVCD